MRNLAGCSRGAEVMENLWHDLLFQISWRKKKNKWLALDISGPVWKKKHRQGQYPVLERHLRDPEWVDRANEAAVNVTNIVLSTVGRKISEELSKIEGHIEDYTDFTFLHGWVTAFKCWYGMGRMKLKGDGGNYNEASLPQHQMVYQVTLYSVIYLIMMGKLVQAYLIYRKGCEVWRWEKS